MDVKFGRWHSSVHTISVAWNNCFRRIFNCCWRERESTKVLQYYCNVLPIPYLIDQRRLIFWCKIRNSENAVLQTLSSLKHNLFIATGSKYDICSYDALVKSAVWTSFATSVLHLYVSVILCICRVSNVVCAALWRNKRNNNYYLIKNMHKMHQSSLGV